MPIRWILIATLGLGGCYGATTAAPRNPPPPTAGPAPTQTGATALTPDGKRFAVERVFEGKCAPPGSRGGCHTITLRPDGTFTNFLYDAAITGTYEIQGSEVVLTANNDPSMVEKLSLSPDRNRLGELDVKHAATAP